MPALFTHYYFAKAVAARLESEGLDFDPAALLWGAQGPDILFYHRALPLVQPGKSLRGVGIALHETEPERIFGAMRTCISEISEPSQKRLAVSYGYGFLCHLALDDSAHPFVYRLADKMEAKTGFRARYLHHKIEHNLDAVLLSRADERGEHTKFSEVLPEREGLQDVVAKLLYAVVQAVDLLQVPKKTFATVIKDCVTNNRLLQDKKGRKRRIAAGLDRISRRGPMLQCFIRPIRMETDADYQNLSNWTWDETTAGGNAAFAEVFDRAVPVAVSLIGQWEAALTSAAPLTFLEPLDFHHGKQGR